MAKLNRLKALQIDRIKAPGMYPDGGGLYLQVTVNSRDREPAKSWIYRYMLRGEPRWMGLGSCNALSLQEARGKALDCRRLRGEGMDPIDARKSAREQAALEAAKAITFKQASAEFINGPKSVRWSNAKHAKQWKATLATYADPIIGGLSVQAIDTGLVLKVLEPIWLKKPETASRVRTRIEAILDWATARGYRQGENPARWRGHLENLLPARSKVRSVEHHAALPYGEIGGFVSALRKQEGTAAKALEFTILTAARTGEVIGARWSEIDFTSKVWTVPAHRMKARKEHRVPLSRPALALLNDLKPKDTILEAQFVFPGNKDAKPLSNMALLMLLRRMGRDDLTTHGFRSTFRDWVAEKTNFRPETAEAALAHTVENAVEAAYRRGDLFEKRTKLMTAWADYCGDSQAGGKVVPIRPRAAQT